MDDSCAVDVVIVCALQLDLDRQLVEVLNQCFRRSPQVTWREIPLARQCCDGICQLVEHLRRSESMFIAVNDIDLSLQEVIQRYFPLKMPSTEQTQPCMRLDSCRRDLVEVNTIID